MILLIFVWTQLSSLSLTAPLILTAEREQPQSEQPKFVSWEREPLTRGTFRLIASCVITLSLCVWTAVHLNIPARFSGNYLRRTGWVIMGLLAPELVVYTAWRQWSSGKELTRQMGELLEERAAKTGNTRKYEWSLVHSFYAGMGGFVIDVPGNKGFVSDRSRFTLTAQGVLLLTAAGYSLPEVNKKAILDRSKADNVAKVLVCLQAAYMIAQCVGRVVVRLPVTLLEVNTLGHVVCALIMYTFWLQKPQDVQVPTSFWSDDIGPLCAYMYMRSGMSREWSGRKDEWSYLHLYDDSDLEKGNTQETVQKVKKEKWIERENSTGRDIPLPSDGNIPPHTTVTIREHQVLRRTNLGPKPSRAYQPSEYELARLRVTSPTRVRAKGTQRVMKQNYYHPRVVHLDAKSVNRWELASKYRRRCLDTYSIYYPRGKLAVETVSELVKDEDAEIEFLVHEVPNWPGSAGLLPKSSYFTWGAISFAVALYGGLHIAGWNGHFPSTIEKMMWRVSSVLIAASGILATIYIAIDRLPSRGKESYLDHWAETFGSDEVTGAKKLISVSQFLLVITTGVVLILPLIGGAIIYIPARLFLVIESFIALRDQPIEVYQTPDWTGWVPHL
ncbi:hypothetical protein FQN50_005710 [Emmonsiellopsis sp. PD_5]|nr:hypothetical protein FQN50_005710 [Emmonsiellopsis sp. PD_5]